MDFKQAKATMPFQSTKSLIAVAVEPFRMLNETGRKESCGMKEELQNIRFHARQSGTPACRTEWLRSAESRYGAAPDDLHRPRQEGPILGN